MNIPEILPCPFCGCPPVAHPKGFAVSCNTPGCAIEGHTENIKKWNRRQPTPEAADKPKAELWAIKWRGEYEPYTHDNEAGARRRAKEVGGYVIPMYREPPVVIPAAHPPKPEPTEAHSKSEYKRLSAQGVNVVPPKPTEEWMEEAAREMIEEEMQAAQWVADGVTPPTEEEWVKRHAATIAKHYSAPAEGWQWVPKEPTEEMIAASCKGPKMTLINEIISTYQVRTGTNLTELGGEITAMHEAYKAMLAAAPKS